MCLTILCACFAKKLESKTVLVWWFIFQMILYHLLFQQKIYNVNKCYFYISDFVFINLQVYLSVCEEVRNLHFKDNYKFHKQEVYF